MASFFSVLVDVLVVPMNKDGENKVGTIVIPPVDYDTDDVEPLEGVQSIVIPRDVVGLGKFAKLNVCSMQLTNLTC